MWLPAGIPLPAPFPPLMLPGLTPEEPLSSGSTHQACGVVCLHLSDFLDENLALLQPTEALPSPTLAPGFHFSRFSPLITDFNLIPPGIKGKRKRKSTTVEQQQPLKT